MPSKSVQLQNGYARIANEILEEMARAPGFSRRHDRLLFALWRSTYGRPGSPKTWETSVKGVARVTGMDRKTARLALEELMRAEVVLGVKSGHTWTLQFQKNPGEWRPVETKFVPGKDFKNGDTLPRKRKGMPEEQNGAALPRKTGQRVDPKEDKDKQTPTCARVEASYIPASAAHPRARTMEFFGGRNADIPF